LVLSRALTLIKEGFQEQSFAALLSQAKALIAGEGDVELEYLAICETTTLMETERIEPNQNYVALIVAWIDGVRLIDNMLLNNN